MICEPFCVNDLMVGSSCIAILFLFLVTIYEFLFELCNVLMIET